jgi:hypothetical protein
MPTNLKYSNGTRNAQQQGLITYAGSGALINIYSGSQPANANTAISGQTLLVTLTVSGSFGTDSNGTITLSTVTNGTAVATGTATFFRITQSNGSTVVMDGSVATSDADLVLNNTSIATGQVVSISAGTIIRANQ